jgi:hypothetical protein
LHASCTTVEPASSQLPVHAACIIMLSRPCALQGGLEDAEAPADGEAHALQMQPFRSHGCTALT